MRQAKEGKSKQVSQKELIAKSNLVNNNPHSVVMKRDGWDAKAEKSAKEITLYDEKIDRIIEAFRNAREVSSLNRVVSKREPGEPIKTQYQKVDKTKFDRDKEFWKQQNRKGSAQSRMKHKGTIPKKDGNPMFEEYRILEEDFNKFISVFRKYYYSGKMMRFRDWLEVVDDLIDVL